MPSSQDDPAPYPVRLPRQYLPLPHGRRRFPPAGRRGGPGRPLRDRLGGAWELARRPSAGRQGASRGHGRAASTSPARAQGRSAGRLRSLRPPAGDGRHEPCRAQTRWRRQDAQDKIRPFLDFAPNASTRDVPDPFYGGTEGFDHALDLIEEAARGLLAELADVEQRDRKARRLTREGASPRACRPPRRHKDRRPPISRRKEHEAVDGEGPGATPPWRSR